MYEPLEEFKGKGKPKRGLLFDVEKVKKAPSCTSKEKTTSENKGKNVKSSILGPDQKTISDYFKKQSKTNSQGDEKSSSVPERNIREMCLSKNAKAKEKDVECIEIKDDVPQHNVKRRRSHTSPTNGEKKRKKSSEEINRKIESLFGEENGGCLGDSMPKISSDKSEKVNSDETTEAEFKLKFSTKERARVSDLVVKNLMPIYRRKQLIADKDQFKKIAKEVSKFLLETVGPKISRCQTCGF